MNMLQYIARHIRFSELRKISEDPKRENLIFKEILSKIPLTSTEPGSH